MKRIAIDPYCGYMNEGIDIDDDFIRLLNEYCPAG